MQHLDSERKRDRQGHTQVQTETGTKTETERNRETNRDARADCLVVSGLRLSKAAAVHAVVDGAIPAAWDDTVSTAEDVVG